MSDDNNKISIFTSYAHKDEELREELDVHLAMVRRMDNIKIWNDRAIQAGSEWDDSIKQELEDADVIFLLVSPRFLASTYIQDVEIKRAMERHDDPNDIARVIPIILKPCDWQETDFARLQALPRNAKPIVQWDDMDEALLNVVTGIKQIIPLTFERKKGLQS